FEISY
ncbi:heme receptor HasR, partial [Vibrio paracholerae 87395]